MFDNPYHAPQTPVGNAAGVVPPFTLTPLHLKILKLYREYYRKTPTLGSLIRKSSWRLVTILMIFGGGGYLLWSYDLIYLMCFHFGLGLAALIRAFQSIWILQKAWPIMYIVIDWNRVDTILDESQVSGQFRDNTAR